MILTILERRKLEIHRQSWLDSYSMAEELEEIEIAIQEYNELLEISKKYNNCFKEVNNAS
jgi:hypothetical protein